MRHVLLTYAHVQKTSEKVNSVTESSFDKLLTHCSAMLGMDGWLKPALWQKRPRLQQSSLEKMRDASNIAGRVEITTDDVVVKMRDFSTPDDEQSLALHISMLWEQCVERHRTFEKLAPSALSQRRPVWSIRAPMGSVLHSVQDWLTDYPAGTHSQQSLRRKRSDTWHQERTGEIILTTVKHSLVHNLPTDTSSTLAHNTLKPESKHSYLYLMSRVTKTNYFGILDPQRG